MNFNDYCRDKAAPPGSSAYYALRRAPAARRALLTALYAYRHELDAAVREVRDPTVGRAKLAWWRNETAALCAGAPTHPVARALAAHGDAAALGDGLRTLLDGYEIDLEQARYLDYPGLRRYLDKVGGGFAALVARATAHDTAGAEVWAPPLGTALALAEMVRDVGDQARYGRIYLPIDEMQRFGVTAADVVNRRYGAPFTALMQFQTGRAREALQTALAALPADERRTQPTLRAHVAMARKLLDEIEADGYQVLHQRIALTPLRKLWLCWRATAALA